MSSHDDQTNRNSTSVATVCRVDSKTYLRIVVNVYATLPVCTVGFVLNVVTFYVLARYKNDVATYSILRMLAVSDNVYLAISMTCFPVRYLVGLAQYGRLTFLFKEDEICPMIYHYTVAARNMAKMVRNWITALISLERTSVIVFPLQARIYVTTRVCNLAVVGIVGFTFATQVWRYNYRQFQMRSIVCPFETEVMITADIPVPGVASGFKRTMHILFITFLPFIVMFAANLIFVVFLTRAAKARKAMSASKSSSGGGGGGDQSNNSLAQHQASILAFSVIVVYLIFEFPVAIRKLIYVIVSGKAIDPRYAFETVSTFLTQLDSCVNFLVYCLSSRKFRDQVRKSFGG
ncbi:uncharacterized protein LOC141911635 [Tubulanus polymorphus]|uniref:uncharacterized protein LOC141911635 n=1 Tax=Tubulanus polymorphus TaxID=672921 RepID=UPI003DA4E8BE